MSRAFDYINGDKVNLKDNVHRQIVINRNKALEKALKVGLDIQNVTASLDLYIDCVKCGNTINKTKYDLDLADFGDCDMADNLPNIKCGSCGTLYRIFNDEIDGLKIDVKQRKPKAIKRK